MFRIENAEETLNKIYHHLLKQGKPCADIERGGCFYRKDGMSCAFGCLIPDEEYEECFEGQYIRNLVYDGYLVFEDETVRSICTEAQGIHDNYANNAPVAYIDKRKMEWNEYIVVKFEQLAQDYKLTLREPNNDSN